VSVPFHVGRVAQSLFCLIWSLGWGQTDDKVTSYYASASYATPDAAVLAEVETCCGFAREINSIQKSDSIVAEALQPEG